MVNKFGKYQIYQKFKTSDGVNYTPLDEYRGILKEDFSKNCLGSYDFSYISQLRYPYITTNETTKHTIPDECIFEVGDNWGYAYNFEDLSPLIEEPYGLINPWERDDYTGYEHKPLEVFSLPINTAVTDLTALFSYAPLTEVDTSKWDTSNVTSMNNMFFACDDLTSLDVSNFNTSAVTSMGGMFNGCTNLTSLDVSNFKTSNVTSMSRMFQSCSGLTSLDLSNFKTSNVEYMTAMFGLCGNLTSLDLSGWNTSKVKNMDSMFDGCGSLTSLDLSSFDVSNVTSMAYMFSSCDNLTYFKHPKKGSCAIPENVVTLDLSALDSSYLSSVSFRNLDKLENIIWGDKSNATFTSLERKFSGCTSLKELDLSGWDVSQVVSASNMLAGCSALTKLNLSGWDLSKIGRYSISFSDCVSLREIEMCDATLETIIHIQEKLAESNLPQVVRLVCNGEDVFTDQGNVEFTFTGSQCNFTLNDTSFYATSSPCKRSLMGDLGIPVLTSCVSAFTNSPITSLISFPNTSNITNMSNMFDGCSNLSSIDMGLFDTSNVTIYEEMFQGCSSLTSFVFNPQNKEELWIPRMLCYCSSLKYADFSGVKFGQSNGLFYGCSSLEEINFSNADFSEIMVEGIDLQSKYIFGQCTSLKTIDLTNAYLGDRFFENMTFAGCSALEEIIVGEIDCGTWQKLEDMKADGKIPENAQLVGTCVKYRNMEVWTGYLSQVDGSGPSYPPQGPYYVEEFTGETFNLYSTEVKPYSYVLNETLFSNARIDKVICLKTPVNLKNINFSNGYSPYDDYEAPLTSIDLSGWEFNRNVFYNESSDVDGIFEGCNYVTKIILGDNFVDHINETGGGINFRKMFRNCGSISSMTQVEDFDKIVNTSNVTDMSYMFYNCGSLTSLDLSNFNTSAVTHMSYMFYNCRGLTSLDVSNFDTSNVTNMSNMFQNCSGLTSLDFSNWDVSNAGVSNMLSGCTNLKTLKYFKNTGSSPKLISTLGHSSFSTIDLSSWDTSNVTSMSNMFSGCGTSSIVFGDNFNTSKVTDMSSMFNTSNITSLDLSNFDTSNVTNMDNMFKYCYTDSLDLSSFDTSNVTNMNTMLQYCLSPKITFGDNFDTSHITNMSGMFNGCKNVKSLDLSSWDTSNVTSMSQMFQNCYGLTSLDVSNFDTSKVTSMSYMFNQCSSLTSVDLSAWDVSNVTNVNQMFRLNNKLDSFKYFKKTSSSPITCYAMGLSQYVNSVDLSGWDTSNVTSMVGMFREHTYLTSVTFGDNFDTSNVTNMGAMFDRCRSLTSLDLSNFNTSNVTDMDLMFYNCSSLTSLDLSNFNTSKVTSMSQMFYFCTALTSVDLSGWDMSNVTSMDSMFFSCNKLKTIYMRGCNQITIDKINSKKPSNAQIITE